ncbi:MAG: hypothetical protein ACLQSR_15700 [Limisphaerales bacterium]
MPALYVRQRCLTLQREQNIKTSLLKVSITGQRVGQSLIVHHRKRNAIRKRPRLIRTFKIKPQSALKDVVIGWNNLHMAVIFNDLKQFFEIRFCRGLSHCIANLDQNPFGGRKMKGRLAVKPQCFFVRRIAPI